MRRPREINFKLFISNDLVRIVEENQPNTIECGAKNLLRSSYLGEFIAEAFVRRLREIVAEEIKNEVTHK